MNLIIAVFLFILGTSCGSFLSVIIHRIKNNQKGILNGRSKCPYCKKKLQAIDMIPLFSYLFLKGKCRFCHKKFSPHYFFLELITGLTFLLVAVKFPFIIDDISFQIDWQQALITLFYLINCTWLIGIFFYDLQYMEIPDIFLFPFIGTALIGSLLSPAPDFVNLAIALGISLVFFGGQILLSKGKWLGEGDLYVGIAMGFMFGWKLLLVAIIMTYLAGTVLSVFLLATQKAKAKSKIAFAPFMVMGSLVTIFFGEMILNWYVKLINF